MYGGARLDTSKPPVLLLRGFPQTYVEFHKVVPLLELSFSLVLLGLRSYSASSTVQNESGSGYSRRLMAQDAVAVRKQLGYEKFGILGHDRGTGMVYRLALDIPEKADMVIVRLTCLAGSATLTVA